MGNAVSTRGRMVDIIVVHIMKTAGVSFLAALRHVYGKVGTSYTYLGDAIRPERNISLHDTYDVHRRVWRAAMGRVGPEVRVLQDHMPVHLYAGLFPEARRVVWLRDPIRRIISRYVHFWGPELGFDIHEYIAEDRAQNVMMYYTAGGDLKRFFFVGIVEHYEEDLTRLAGMLGWPPGYPVVRRNECRHPRLKARLLADKVLVAEIERLNQPDIELYRRALEVAA